MAGSLKGLRAPTLEATYLNLAQLIRTESEGDKAVLRDLVDGRQRDQESDWDAFDQSIRLIIVDQARLHDELSRILFETNKGVIRRAVQCQWFFESTPLGFFQDELLPVVSVSTRLKVISALGRARRSEDDAVSMFTWVRQRYGLHAAEPLLPRCPQAYVADLVLGDTRPVLARTFLAIARRFPELGVQMAAHWMKKEKSLPCAISRLLSTRPDLLMDWADDQLPVANVKVGRKLLRRWRARLESPTSQLDPENVLTYGLLPRLFRGQPHEARVLLLERRLRGEGRLTLDNWTDGLDGVKDLIGSLRPETRDKLLHQTFQALYGLDLWVAREACTPLLLQLTSRQRRAEQLTALGLDGDEGEYLYLQPACQAVPKLIAQVKKCSESSQRSKLVIAMIASCRVTWDRALLSNVALFVEELAETDANVAKTALSDLNNCLRLVRDLPCDGTRALAATVTRLIETHLVGDKLLFHHELFLTHCLDNGEGVEHAVDAWLHDWTACRRHAPWDTSDLLRFPKAPRAPQILALLYQRLPLLAKDLPDDSFIYHLALLFLHAAREVGVELTEMEDGGKAVLDLLERCGRYYDPTLGYRVWQQRGVRFAFGPGLWPLLAEHPVLVNVLRARPQLVTDHINAILKELANYPFRQERFLKAASILAFYNIGEKIKTWCKECREEDTRDKVLYMFSYVATIAEFEQLAGDCLVKGARIDTSYPSSVLFLSVPRHLRNLSPPAGLFATVRGCLVGGGDLLYAALPAFHKACYNCPVSVVLEEVLPMLQAPVSVMKKAVAIVVDVCPRHEALAHLATLWTTSRHYSARTVLLEHLLRIFLDDPSEELWSTVKGSILESDEPLLPSLPSCSRLPDAYVSDFATTVWNMLESLPISDQVRAAQERLITDLRRVHLLDDSLCQTLIRPHLFSDDIATTFALRYLPGGRAPLPDKLQFVKALFDERVDAHPDAVIRFVSAMVEEKSVGVFLPAFAELFASALSRVELFEARWMLQCLCLKQDAVVDGEVDAAGLRAVGEAIARRWLTEPDRALLHPLLTQVLVAVFLTRPHLLAVALGLVESDAVVCVTALQALPSGLCTDQDLEKLMGIEAVDDAAHVRVLRAVKSFQDSSVQLYLKQFLALEHRSPINRGRFN